MNDYTNRHEIPSCICANEIASVLAEGLAAIERGDIDRAWACKLALTPVLRADDTPARRRALEKFQTAYNQVF